MDPTNHTHPTPLETRTEAEEVDGEGQTASTASPASPKRSPLEVAALFLGIMLVLFLWWRAQHPEGSSKAGARSEALSAERLAQAALASPKYTGYGRPPGPLWSQAREQYRSALRKDPKLARARFGLAAMAFLEGDRRSARTVLAHPVDVPDDGRLAWQAFEAAFGARGVPEDAAARARYMAALKRRDLGWPRFVALRALATDRAEAERWTREIRGRHKASPLTLALIAFGSVVFFIGAELLRRLLAAPPPNRLDTVRAPAGSLIVLSVMSLLVAQLPVLLLQMAMLSKGSVRSLGEQQIAITALGTALGIGLMLLSAHALLRSVGSGVEEFGWRVRGALKWSIGGYLALIPLLAVSLLVSSALYHLFPNIPTPDNPATGMAIAASGPQLLLVLLFTSVLAPVAEEFVMRGLLFRGLAKRYGLVVGALASSFVFAGLHPQLPAGFPPLFVIGLGLCFVYRASGSLVPAIIIHGLSNAVVLVMARMAMG